MVTEDYVSFETAKLLKERGFGERCIYVYRHDGSEDIWDADKEAIACQKPTLQMTVKWLREIHYCHIVVGYTFKADAGLTNDYVSYVYQVENAKTLTQHISDRFFGSYEEACEAAIKYCLEILI